MGRTRNIHLPYLMKVLINTSIGTLNDQRSQWTIINKNNSSFKQRGSIQNVSIASLSKKYKDFRRNVKLPNLRKLTNFDV